MNDNTTKTRNSPIFIVGAARSGTTLLQYMLRSHPRISLPSGESHFIIPIYQQADSFGDLGREENLRRVLETIYRKKSNFIDADLHGLRFDAAALAAEFHAAGVKSIAGLIDALFAANAHGEGKQRWGDKTPYYALHLDTLKTLFPDAQIIHIIRDGRDCALSMLNRKFDLGIYNTFDAAYTWQRYVTAAREAGARFGAEYYFEFRYEDLLIDPAAVMRQICRFLGEEYSDSLVDFKKPKTRGKTPLLQQPVQRDNTEKWRAAMTAGQIKVFEAVAGNTLAGNQYPLATAAAPLSPPQELAYRLHSRVLDWYNHRLRSR